MTHPAGRELDALIAERVMWLMVKPITVIGAHGAVSDIGTVGERYKMADGRMGVPARAIPAYSTEIAAAWEVVERLATCHPTLERFTLPDRWCCAMQLNADTISSVAEYADSAPLAICLAALRAVGAPLSKEENK